MLIEACAGLALRLQTCGPNRRSAMETAGEERVRIGIGLRKLEDAASVLEEGAQASPPKPVSLEFPKTVFSLLNDLTIVSSRDDAERLLASGVSMWNSVIVLEEVESPETPAEALVKLRHVAVDCIYMASTVLGGISARFNIDEISLLKFYTSCGRKYASTAGDMEMASVCFAKATEFGKSAKLVASESETGARALSKAMFDLLLGSAECAWDANDTQKAEDFVAEASTYLSELPFECEYMASVLFNLGLLAYQAKETPKALIWLRKSMDTRALPCNPAMDCEKQAKSARLAGVCHIAMKDFGGAREAMELAESTFHDPVGSYLLLKLDVLTQAGDALSRLCRIVDDTEASLDICMGSVAILVDAQRVDDACKGFEKLMDRFAADGSALVSVIGPRYFEATSSAGHIEKALEIVDVCLNAMSKLERMLVDRPRPKSGEDTQHTRRQKTEWIEMWSALLLFAGSTLAERKEFANATRMLTKCIGVAEEHSSSAEDLPERSVVLREPVHPQQTVPRLLSHNVVLQNMGAVCRLAASCAFCSVSEMEGLHDIGASPSHTALPQATGALVKDGILCAEKAKSLDKSDFAARLVLFRLLLLQGDTSRAAEEMRAASREVVEFDVGALVEAACDAKDAGSSDTVLAVLQCLLKGYSSATIASSKSRADSTACLDSPGFIGTILICSVNVIVERVQGTSNSTASSMECEPRDEFLISREDADTLLLLLQDGHSCASKFSVAHCFGDDSRASSGLKFLCDVAWNTGRQASKQAWFGVWESAFSICESYCSMRPLDDKVADTVVMCKLMASTSEIEHFSATSGTHGDLGKALSLLKDARGLVTKFSEEKLGERLCECRAALLLPVLEARCHAAKLDHSGISKVLDSVSEHSEQDPETFEQLASIAFGMTSNSGSGVAATLRLDNVTRALACALDLRMSTEVVDVKHCVATARELITVELLRMTAQNRAYSVMQRALGILRENKTLFPTEEQRWFTATSWDTAHILCKTGRKVDALQWASMARDFTVGNAALETYVPRIQSFISLLQNSDKP